MGFLFGGSTPNYGYKKGGMEDRLGMEALPWQTANRAGAKFTGQYDNYKGNKIPRFDWSETGKNISMADATKGYDFSGMDSGINTVDTAIAGMKNRPNYNPYQFNFGNDDIINQATNNQYALGSDDVRREGAGQLEKMRETVGPRQAGLLLKAGENSQRNVAQQLAKMRMELDTNALNQKLSLGQQQQIAQAGENKSANDNIANWYQSLAGLGQAKASMAGDKIAKQGGITADERAYADKGLDSLQDLYTTLMTSRRGGGQRKKTGLFDGISQIGNAATSFASFIPKKT